MKKRKEQEERKASALAEVRELGKVTPRFRNPFVRVNFVVDTNVWIFCLQQKERERQRSAAKKLIHNNQLKEKKTKDVGGGGENRGEFDDLISALRAGDVFGDELSKIKGRRRTGPPKQARRVENASERERPSPKMPTKF